MYSIGGRCELLYVREVDLIETAQPKYTWLGLPMLALPGHGWQSSLFKLSLLGGEFCPMNKCRVALDEMLEGQTICQQLAAHCLPCPCLHLSAYLHSNARMYACRRAVCTI